MMGGPKGGFGRQLKFWRAGAGAGGEQIVPILSIAALVGATLAAEVTEVDAALFDAPAVTALAEVTPAPVPEATSLPPPQEANTITEEEQIRICLLICIILNPSLGSLFFLLTKNALH